MLKIDDDVINSISRSRAFKNMKEIDLSECNISAIGLLNISRSPNPYFKIQYLLDDFGKMIDSHFVKNMVQQEYFENVETINLEKCEKLKI